jgi:hypothetical protein
MNTLHDYYGRTYAYEFRTRDTEKMPAQVFKAHMRKENLDKRIQGEYASRRKYPIAR